MNHLSTLLVTVAFVLFSAQISGQIYDFEDAVVPAGWQGSRTDFQVSNSNQLQLNAPLGSTTSFLSWPSINAQNVSWEFYVKYTFAASATNYALFYLFSTEADFTSANNVAYYLKIGGATGSTDKIELIYQQGSNKQVILESHTGSVGGSQVGCRIHISKHAGGVWELKTDSAGGYNYLKEASAQHWIGNAFNYSGIRCVYSSTRRDKFYFDDISIHEPFAIQGYTFNNDSTLRIYFNRTLSADSAPIVAMNFDPLFTLVSNSNYLELCFTARIRTGTYSGTIGNVFAGNGDSLLDTSLILIKEPTYYVGQLRISECMSDPSPSYGLPEVEWVELVNMSDQQIDLNKTSISDPSLKVLLPSYLLDPDSVVIVCGLNACSNFFKRNCIEVNTFPSLNNTADSVFIWANDTLLLDFIWYDVASLATDFRSDGGYSMVRKEYPEECVLSQKIDFSEDNVGGSPGTISSRLRTPGVTIEAVIISGKEVAVKINAEVADWDTSFYALMNVEYAAHNSCAYGTAFTLYLNQELEAGNAYNFHIDSIRTCRNQTKSIDAEIEIVYPKSLERDEVFINEILYNPNSGGVDFIELYNSTSKYIQLRNSHFYNKSSTTLQHAYLSEHRIIKPFNFIALTSDTAILKREYNNTAAENTFQMTRFLSLADTGGELIWLNTNGDTLDRVYYGDSYHNPLHRNTEGYSLEKISSSVPYFIPANWTTSAAYATPGSANSHNVTALNGQQKSFYCNPCHVTTNVNGQNDFAALHLGEVAQGCYGSISIYRISGEKVIDLIVNQSLGSVNVFQWNGQQQGGGILEDGIYVAVAEWWSSDGQTYVSKIALSTSQY